MTHSPKNSSDGSTSNTSGPRDGESTRTMTCRSEPILNWSKEGDPAIPGHEPLIAEGVRGFAFDEPDGIYIPWIRAERPGNGDVSRFLDGLPCDRRVVFTTVINQKLRGMLARRGYVEAFDGIADVMERKP